MGHVNETLKNVKVSEPLHGKMCIAVALNKKRYKNIKTFLEKAIRHELLSLEQTTDQASELRAAVRERE